MYSNLIISSFLLSTASAFHFFNIYPAQPCKEGGFDLCDESSQTEFSKDAIKACGDGTYCSTGLCGTWVGQKKMCCSGIANTAAGGSITNQLTQACAPYKSQLENFDVKGSDAKKPLTGDQCKDKLKVFGVGVDGSETGEFITGNRTSYKSCCAMTGDALTLYSDFLSTVDTAVCIPALDAKEGGGDASGKSTGTKMGTSVMFAGLSVLFGVLMA